MTKMTKMTTTLVHEKKLSKHSRTAMPVLYLCITQPKRYFTPQLGKYFSVVKQTIGDEQAEKEAGCLLVVNGGLSSGKPTFFFR